MGEQRVVPASDGPRFGRRLLLVDESVVDADVNHDAYVIGAAVLLRADARSARRLAVEATRVFGGHPRTRPFHHRKEGPIVRRQMLEAVACSCEAVLAVAITHAPRSALEAARWRALREILAVCDEVDRRPDEMLIESREQAPKVVGQNRIDHRVIIEARRAGIVSRGLRYDWAGKDEPLLWFADAIAGTFADEMRGRASLASLIPEVTVSTRTLPWSERA